MHKKQDPNSFPLVHRFRALYPTVDLALTEATSDVQIAALRRKESHAGIVWRHDEPSPMLANFLDVIDEAENGIFSECP